MTIDVGARKNPVRSYQTGPFVTVGLIVSQPHQSQFKNASFDSLFCFSAWFGLFHRSWRSTTSGDEIVLQSVCQNRIAGKTGQFGQIAFSPCCESTTPINRRLRFCDKKNPSDQLTGMEDFQLENPSLFLTIYQVSPFSRQACSIQLQRPFQRGQQS